MADAYLKVKDNGAQGLALTREEADVSVTELKTDLRKKVLKTSDPFELTDGGYIRYESGSVYARSTTTNFAYTDYIDVHGYERIRYKQIIVNASYPAHGMAFYDENYGYLGGVRSVGSSQLGFRYNEINVPNDAYFARFTWWAASVAAERGGDFFSGDVSRLDATLEGRIERLEDGDAEIAPIIGSPTLYLADTPTDPDFNYATAAQGGTTYADIYTRYDALCTAYPKWLKRGENIGTDSEDYPIAHYTLQMYDPIVDSGSRYSNWDGTDEAPSNLWKDNTVYRRVLLSAGVHGPEKAAVLALYYLTKEILSSSAEWARYLRSNAIIEIIPIICPGNFNANRRENINGVNVNRDYFNQTTAEAQAMTTFIESIRADLHCALDFHTAHGRMGFVAVPPTNPKIDLLLTMENQTFAACVDNWESVTTTLDISDTFYPYAYANISANQGTFPDYISRSGITDYACTVETPTGTDSNTYTSAKAVAASKMSMDIGCNLLQRMLAI